MANAKFILGQTGGQIDVSTAAAPATPAAGYVTLYADTDKALYSINEDGVVTPLGTGVTGPQGPTGATGAAGATGPAGSNATSPITVQQTNSLVSTAIGATATAGSSIVIGATACSLTACTIVMGANSRNCGGKSIIIGANSCVVIPTSEDSIVIGNCSYTDLSLDYGGKVVIGSCARGGYAGASVAIGFRAVGNNGGVGILNTGVGENAVSIGAASNSGTNAVTIGPQACSGGGYGANDGSVAIGYRACNPGILGSVSIGSNSISSANNSVSIGLLSRIFCGATGAIVLGANSVGGTGACNSVVLGSSSEAVCFNSIVLGKSAFSCSFSNIAIGENARVTNSGAIAIGFCTCATTLSSIAIGSQSCVSGSSRGIAIGNASISSADDGITLGISSCSTGKQSIAIGCSTVSSSDCSISIGRCAVASHTCSVALGPGITTEKANTVHLNSLIAYGQAASKANAVGSTGGTATLNWDNSNIQTVTLTSSISSLTKSNPIDGAVYTVFVTQGGSGGYTVDWGADVKWAGGTGPTLSTAVGATDAVSLVYVAGITGYYGNANLNFA